MLSDTVYKSFILPVIDYCDIAWACYGDVNAGLQQRRATKIVLNCNNSDIALCNLSWDSLQSRRELHIFNSF